jgi:hypothetical protein
VSAGHQGRVPRRIPYSLWSTPPWLARYFRKLPGSIAIVESTVAITSSIGMEARFFSSIAIFSIATPHNPSEALGLSEGLGLGVVIGLADARGALDLRRLGLGGGLSICRHSYFIVAARSNIVPESLAFS